MARYVEAPPKNNAYTGILAISLLVLIGVSALLYYDKDSMGAPPTSKLTIDVPGASNAPAGKAAAQ